MCQSNRVLAALLAHLAEVDARGLHRTRACSNLYTYCIYELRMPEDTSDEVPFSDELPQSGALTESPRRRGRHVPAAVRRAVCERDGHRCAYIDARGVRCRETSRLELHHREPFARGGPSTAENLSLHCAAHNALAAEQDFGHASAIARRDYPHFTERTLLCEAQRE